MFNKKVEGTQKARKNNDLSTDTSINSTPFRDDHDIGTIWDVKITMVHMLKDLAEKVDHMY